MRTKLSAEIYRKQNVKQFFMIEECALSTLHHYFVQEMQYILLVRSIALYNIVYTQSATAIKNICMSIFVFKCIFFIKIDKLSPLSSNFYNLMLKACISKRLLAALLYNFLKKWKKRKIEFTKNKSRK